MKQLALALCLVFAHTAQAAPLVMYTEEYPPFNFKDGKQLKGISVDQVKKIMEAAKLDYTMEMLPWARAFSLAESQPSTCVFTTGMLPERLPKFQWVQPLVLDVMVMVRKSGKPYQPANLEEAKTFVIGVHKDDSAEIYARQQGFPHLDSAPTLELSLKKLLNDRVQMVIMLRTSYESLRQKGHPIEPVLTLEGTRAGIACNRAVPKETIAAMQEQLDRLIADGTQSAINKQYATTGK